MNPGLPDTLMATENFTTKPSTPCRAILALLVKVGVYFAIWDNCNFERKRKLVDIPCSLQGNEGCWIERGRVSRRSLVLRIESVRFCASVTFTGAVWLIWFIYSVIWCGTDARELWLSCELVWWVAGAESATLPPDPPCKWSREDYDYRTEILQN